VTNQTHSRIIANRYKLIRSIGAGGLGEVFEAHDLKITPATVVAIKILHPSAAMDLAMIEQIRHEFKVMEQLEHPNILWVKAFDTTFDLAYIVYEYAPGGSLKELLKVKPFSLDKMVEFITLIASALELTHRHGFIHRDIKPQNILIGALGEPLLADFSLAILAEKRKRLVKADAWGTAEYAAPEVWQGETGRPSDIYALGVVTYEMLTGRPPFEGTPEELEYKHLNESVPSVRRYFRSAELAERLDIFFERVLSKKPSDRPYITEFYEAFMRAVKMPVRDIVHQNVVLHQPPALTSSEKRAIRNNGITLRAKIVDVRYQLKKSRLTAQYIDPDTKVYHHFLSPEYKGDYLELVGKTIPVKYEPPGYDRYFIPSDPKEIFLYASSRTKEILSASFYLILIFSFILFVVSIFGSR
jgi:serine/threonine protein kinase